MASNDNTRAKAVQTLLAAMPPHLDKEPYLLAEELVGLLNAIKDADTDVCTGTNGVEAQLWFTVQGQQWVIRLAKVIPPEKVLKGTIPPAALDP